MAKVAEIIARFKASPKGLRCRTVRSALEELQFTVRDATAGHRVVTHAGLQEFYGTSFNCGHGRNQLVKPIYVRNLIRLLIEREAELEAINGE